MSTQRATVVIAARNEADYIAALLRSIFVQDIGADNVDVVIVDGRSEDDTEEIIRSTCGSAGWSVRTEPNGFCARTVTLLDNPHRTTPHAFNIGAAAAQTDTIVIVGAHSTLDPRFVGACVLALDETSAAVVGGQIEIITLDRRASPLALAQGSALAMGGASYRSITNRERREADTVPFPAFRKSTWSSVGGFDEALLRNQDDEFILRVRQAGGAVLLCPQIQSTYYSRPSITGLRRQYFEYGLYRVATVRKRGAVGSLRPFAPLVLLPAVVLPTLILARRRTAMGLAPLIGYASLTLLEGLRLNRAALRPALRSAIAIAVMHWGYSLGEWLGILRLFRRPQTPT